jgi:hypothetical protein
VVNDTRNIRVIYQTKRKIYNPILEVIADTVNRFDLIYDLLKQTLNKESVPHNQVPIMIKRFNLTIPQIGYYLNLLVNTGIIDVPFRQVTEFIKWTAENFQSKKQESIQPSSLRSKYSVPDLS